MYDRTVLSNGLRVLSSTMPHTRSVSVGIFVGAGSRYEDDAIAAAIKEAMVDGEDTPVAAKEE